MKTPNPFPVLLESFFMDRLMRQRQASPHTIASYRDTFRPLIEYAQQRLRKAPSQLTVPDLDTAFLGTFLHHLEQKRDDSARSRTYVSLLAIRFSAMWHCTDRNTAPLPSASSPCPANATCVGQYASSHPSR